MSDYLEEGVVINILLRLCCNASGVLCLTASGVVILWNPAIRKSILLPEPILQLKADRVSELAHGFGLDSEGNDYKVVRFSHSCDGVNGPGAEVYELSKNAWRDISHLAPPHFVESMVSAYFEGAVHWVAKSEECKLLVLAFDMGKEVFIEYVLPENMDKFIWITYVVLVYRESLAVATRDRYEHNNPVWAVWVMEDYGDPNSWAKLFSINCFRGFDQILGFTNSGQALLVRHDDGCLLFCDHKRLESRFHEIRGYVRDYYQHAASTYVESLVLLDKRETLVNRSDDGFLAAC